MSHPILPEMKHNVALVMAGIPEPPDWTPLPPRELETRPVLPRTQPERRDTLRNLWANLLTADLYAKGSPSLESQAFFRDKPTLDFTLKHKGMDLFSQVSSEDVMRSCEAFYRQDGWMLLWSLEHGTGKTTFALWHLLRHMRILAESLADADDGSAFYFRPCDTPGPLVAFDSWPLRLSEAKRQIGSRGGDNTMERLKSADILILEDIGPMTQWEGNLLEDLLGERYAQQKRTIICARAASSLAELEDNTIGKRIFGMVRQRGAIVQVGGQGFRTQSPRSVVTTPF